MNKIKTQEQIAKISEKLHSKQKKIVTTNGVFDILHTGHVQLLEESKKLGNTLVVCVNTDKSVKQNKGDKRPINDETERTKMLSALKCVDYVVLFDELEPSKILSVIKPDFHTKSAEYTLDKIKERETVEANKGEIKLLQLVQGKSTTQLIKKIVETYGNEQTFKETKGYAA